MRLVAIGIAVVLGGCRCSDPPSPRTAAPAERIPITAATRPTAPPALPATVIAWSVAEAANTARAWDDAAAAYERELASCDDCREAAYAVVLARKNGLKAEPIQPPPGDGPAPMPPRVQAVVDALDHYIAIAAPDDPDLAGMKFLAANALSHWRQPDALTRFEDVITNHPTDPTAEYSANLLLNTLMQQQRFAELRTWVERLRADTAFLADKPDLAATLERLHEQLAQN